MNDKINVPIFIGGTYWTLNGVNIFSENLARGLRARGYNAQIFLTEECSHLITVQDPPIPRPPDIPFINLPVPRSASWGAHWGAMIRFLENHAPCIYLPNSDYRHSSIIPLLSSRVGVIGIIHSDDPLHYDHADRLGKYWTRTVCTSQTIQHRFLNQSPSSAKGLSTIPIGVLVPSKCPSKTLTQSMPLQLIYHGALKRHQKRVFDLLAIVTRLAQAKIPVQLTIAGGGPDSDELRAKAAPLVAQGYIRFLGVVPHQEMGAILDQQHIYLLTSDFEGMPNALLEAMGRGCIPIVTAMDSAVPDLVSDGINGFIVAIGDFDAFAARIELLYKNQDRIHHMSHKAHHAVSSGQYHIEHMVASYQRLIDEVALELDSQTYQRPIGQIIPPPRTLANESIFPIDLSQNIPNIGLLPPFVREFREFIGQVNGITNPHSSRIHPLLKSYLDKSAPHLAELKGQRVIIATPMLLRNGVNTFAINLIRGLQSYGIDTRLLITEENSNLISISAPRLSIPPDIKVDFLPVPQQSCWGEHWGAMIRYLESQAPCFYLPNYDWRHSCVCPLLPRSVITIGILHKDEGLYHDHCRRLHPFWNAIVAADMTIFRRLADTMPGQLDRMVVIPGGIDIPAEPAIHAKEDGGFRIAVIAEVGSEDDPCLRLLPTIAKALPDADLTVIAIGGDPTLLTSCADQFGYTLADCSRQASIAPLLDRLHVIIFPGPFAGLTETLAEAMGRGCIPLIAKTVAATIDDTLIDVGTVHGIYQDETALCQFLSELNQDPVARRQAAAIAADHAAAKCYRLADTILDYVALFQRCLIEQGQGKYRRSYQQLSHPPANLDGINLFPVTLTFNDPVFGSFPAQQPDFAAFCAQIDQPAVTEIKPDHDYPVERYRRRFVTRLTELKGQRVIVATPILLANGVNTFAINLVRGLQGCGIDATLLITEENSDLVSINAPRLAIPADIRVDFLPVGQQSSWGEHWGAMIHYLENQAPCFYLPNYDWRHSCVCPLLPRSVITIGILHNDEELYYDHWRRLAPFWNAIVATDTTIFQRLADTAPSLLDRTVMMPSSIDNPAEPAPADHTAAQDKKAATMIPDYIELFQRCLNEQRLGGYQRPYRQLSHPPASLDGIDLFPVTLAFTDPLFGAFPTQQPDFVAFCQQIDQPVVTGAEPDPDYPIEQYRQSRAAQNELNDLSEIADASFSIAQGAKLPDDKDKPVL